METKIPVGLGKPHKKKPDRDNIVKDKYYAMDKFDYYELKYIVDEVSNNGVSLMSNVLQGGLKKENFVVAQLFMLDFDGASTDSKTHITKGTDISFSEIKERAESYGLDICFAYKTFSCPDTEEFYKFRIGFLMQDPIFLAPIATLIYNELKTLFPECDSACAEISRIFLGGKKLIYYNPDSRIQLLQLTHALYKKLKNDDSNNFSRNITSFANAAGIATINNRIAAGTYNELSLFEEMYDSANLINYMTESQNSSYFYIASDCSKREKELLHQNNTSSHSPANTKSEKKKRYRINLKEKVNACKLLDAFFSGMELDHPERFMLATNFVNVVNGNKLFMETLNKYYDEKTVSHAEADMPLINNYKPQHCNCNCRFYNECQKYQQSNSIITKILNDRTITVKDEKEYIDDPNILGKIIYNNLINALNSNQPGFHVIKSQTGSGKTTQLVKLISENPDKKFLIAEPTNAMKRELEELFKAASIEVAVTDSAREISALTYEQKLMFQGYHQKGAHKQARALLQEVLTELRMNPEANHQDIAELENVLSGLSGFIHQGNVITTHSMLIYAGADILKNFDAIIIDEDILYLQLLHATRTISKKKLEKVKNSNQYPYTHIADEMLKAEAEKYYKCSWNYTATNEWDDKDPIYNTEIHDNCINITEDLSSNFEEESSDNIVCDNNVTDLVSAGSYVLDAKNNIYHYIYDINLPPHKYILLSATINEDLLKEYFHGRHNVYAYPETSAKYSGRLIQFTYHSMSRKDLSDKQYVYDFARDIAKSKEVNIITFLSEEKKHKNLNRTNTHFGNAIGINEYKDVDELVIIGTPFAHQRIYRLICCQIYDSKIATKTAYTTRINEYKGRSFRFMSFDNPKLQLIQHYCIESELEQAIGRARLLRNPGTVYLFSYFPCEQAEIHTEDYLQKYKARD